ncbi:MAG: transglutaminase domain-containing protein [Dehalococcoidia bacterium]|nr:transglutaminase domain-containing protein [Dehalococcoidia bacterium]
MRERATATGRGKLLSRRELFVLALVGLPLVVPGAVIQAANWVEGLPSLIALFLVPLVLWAYIARSGLRWWAAHAAALVIGLIVAIIVGGISFSETAGLSDLVTTVGEWFGAIGTAEGHKGEAITGLLLICVALWTGYASVWLTYRRQLSLLAALPGLGVLLVVLTFLPPDEYWYFFAYLLAAAPGVAYRNKGMWSIGGRKAPLVGTLVAGVVLMAITLVPVSRTPAPKGTVIPLSSVLEDPWLDFQQSWSSLFSGVPNRRNWPSITLPANLPMDGPLPSSEELMFSVDSFEPHRWRMQVYETYTGSGWERPKVAVYAGPEEVELVADAARYGPTRRPVEASVRLYSKTRNIVTVGEPLDAGTPYRVLLSPAPSFRMDLADSQESYLPPNLSYYREVLVPFLDSTPGADLSNVHVLNRTTVRALDIQPGALLKAWGFEVTAATEPVAGVDLEPVKDDPLRYVDVERAEDGLGPPLALIGKHTLLPPWRYPVAGSVSMARADDLRRSFGNYPKWITDRYLQLPPDFSPRARRLARSLTRFEVTAYDAAEAIRQYLVTLSYSEQSLTPPEGTDWVDFFLFEHQRGFCQNFATAMITMLRSLGIPARLAVGFAPGDWNEDKGVWEVKAQHYHAWPEVYFPGFGWIEFEPTPADVQPSLQELGFQLVGRVDSEGQAVDPCVFAQDDPTAADPELCPEILDPNAPGLAGAFSEFEDEQEIPLVGTGSAWGPLDPTWTLLGIGLAVGLAVPVGTASYMRWSVRRFGYPTVVYALTWFLGRLNGVGARPHDTPWEYYSRLRVAFPDHQEPLQDITRAFVDCRYGPNGDLSDGHSGSVRTAWRRVRWAMLRRVVRRLFPR